MILQNHLPDRLLFILIHGVRKVCKIIFLLGPCFLHPICQNGDVGLTLLLFVREDSLLHLRLRDKLPERCKDLLRNCVALIGELLLALSSNDFINETNDFLVDIVRLVDGLDHLIFRDLLCPCFDHDDLCRGGSDSQLQIALIPLLLGRIDDEFPVDHANLGHRTWAVERNIRDAGRNRAAKHGDKLRTALRVDRHDQIVQGYIVAEILREERSHRTVNDACSQNRVLTRLALSFVEAPRNLTNCVSLLLKLHREREEIDAFSRCVGSSRCREHRRVTVVHECSTIRLGRDPADIDTQRAAGQFHGIPSAFFHLGNSFVHATHPRINCKHDLPCLSSVCKAKSTPYRTDAFTQISLAVASA